MTLGNLKAWSIITQDKCLLVTPDLSLSVIGCRHPRDAFWVPRCVCTLDDHFEHMFEN